MKKLLTNFWLVLILLVFVSYGQMLWMQPWEDDNALFIKLANLQESVGFFGKGPLGEGVYKYAAIPFIPIYSFFGHNPVFYFALLIILYCLATISVYKVFTAVLGEREGKVAGLVFGAGYTTSDGFWRMANSATTSITIILVGLFFLFYWKYFKQQKIYWYLIALATFFFSMHIAISRTHYLFLVVLAFELIFFFSFKSIKTIVFPIFRILPFFVIFNKILFAGDSRSSVAKDYVLGILSGKLYLAYGYLSSLANLIFPDWLFNPVLNISKNLTVERIILFMISFVIIILLLRNHKKRKILIPIFVFLLILWSLWSRSIFTNLLLGVGQIYQLTAFVGGLVLIFALCIFVSLKKGNRIFLFLFFWMVANILAYSSYYPTVAYDTVNRYIAHSFFIYAGILGFLFVNLRESKNKISNIAAALIVLVTVGNLVNAFLYQRKILETRSFPVKSFYQDLKVLLPTLNKGDVLYFDVAPGRQRNFRDAISAAMVPDSGSFAWRYGVDRYDFFLITDFDSLVKTLAKEKVDPGKIHSFWYSQAGLVDTSNSIRAYFEGSLKSFEPAFNLPTVSETQVSENKGLPTWSASDLEISFKEPISSIHPLEVILALKAIPLNSTATVYPFVNLKSATRDFSGTPWKEPKLEEMAIGYKKYIEMYYQKIKIKTSSQWQARIEKHLADMDESTVWQSDRTAWTTEQTFLQVELPQLTKLGKVNWQGGSRNNFPISYVIETSLDGKSWQEVAKVEDFSIDIQIPQEVKLKPSLARYVKMTIFDTLGQDSPMISEFIVIPEEFSSANVTEIQDFINNPFIFVNNKKGFIDRLSAINYTGTLQPYWWGDGGEKWLTQTKSEIKIIYDGKLHYYSFILPAGGTKIDKIRLSNFKIPGQVVLEEMIIQIPKVEVQ